MALQNELFNDWTCMHDGDESGIPFDLNETTLNSRHMDSVEPNNKFKFRNQDEWTGGGIGEDTFDKSI